MDVLTADPSIFAEVGQSQQTDKSQVWKFDQPDQVFFGFHGRGTTELNYIGVLSFDTTCDPQYVEPVVVIPPPTEPITVEYTPEKERMKNEHIAGLTIGLVLGTLLCLNCFMCCCCFFTYKWWISRQSTEGPPVIKYRTTNRGA